MQQARASAWGQGRRAAKALGGAVALATSAWGCAATGPVPGAAPPGAVGAPSAPGGAGESAPKDNSTSAPGGAPAPASSAGTASEGNGASDASRAGDAAGEPASGSGMSDAAWARVPKDVRAVVGAAALGCTPRRAGEWVRITCDGVAYNDRAPEGVVSVGVGSGSEAWTGYADDGSVWLEFRLTPTTRVAAVFAWGGWLQHGFEARGDRPDLGWGRFIQAPPAKYDPATRRFLTECNERMGEYGWQEPEAEDHGALLWPWDCVRSHGFGRRSCGDLIECLHMEPSSWVDCPRGEVAAGVAPSRCFIVCGPEHPPCPLPMECGLEVMGHVVCALREPTADGD